LFFCFKVQPVRSVPVHPDVKLVKLPFYDIHAELLRPATLIAQGSNRFQDAQFQFFLTPSQATDIASNRDIQIGSKLDYLYQAIP
jgi:E3 SUMO-protein ligase PIAS3